MAATEQLSELLRVHDLGTSVAVGNRYLKQQCLVAVRGVLERLGSERHLGPEWKRGNPFWDRAEAAMLEPLHARMQAEWASLQWLTPEWVQMGSESFSAEDLAELLRHFRTAIGEKQAKIIDHSIAFHVAGYYGMSGKLIQDYPGTEAEQKALTYAWDDEDRAMRFSIESSNNIEGQRFALSPLGAKYQKTLIIKLTGILNARIDELARGLPGEAASETALADPFLTDFRAANDR
ncbi:MAG: hypothetical protein GC151_05515 [Betaproteobacteria bacterium]|nr:hypothetical protein [Betaproteobacteria bacterium]